MKTADDLVLEYALGRVFGRDDTELTQRILAGCQRSPSDDPVDASSTRRRVAWLFAAAVLVALGAVWAWPSRPAAEAETPVVSVRGDTWAPLPRTSLEPGDVLLAVDAPVRLRLDSGAVVTARPGTILRLDDRASVSLSVGTLHVTSGASIGLRVSTSAATVRLAPAADAVVAATPGYGLESELALIELARRIHVLHTTLAVSLSVTLSQGAGELIAGHQTQALIPGVSVRQDPERDEVRLARLQQEVGTWTVTVRAGGREFIGVEICRAGAGDHSIVSDTAVTIGERRLSTTVLVSYDPRRERYSGIYVDNFGGELGLLLGPASDDPKDRVLRMDKFHGGTFDMRMRMQWISEDERRTVLETLLDGEWRPRREMIHRRQEAAPSDLFQVILNVRDMQKQVEFYRDVLGLEVVEPAGATDYSERDWVRLSAGTTSLALHSGRKSDHRGDEARLSFRVEDLDAARARVERAGAWVGEVESPAPGVTLVDCRDPEGNAFHLEVHVRATSGR